MIRIPVRLGPRSYSISIGGSLPDALAAIPKPQKALIATHPSIFRLYGKALLRTLERWGAQTSAVLIPEGEANKRLGAVQKIYEAAIRRKLDRTSMIFALGGGVIGDLAGFAAATYLRGVRVAQIPTTLLAMVDSAIGGKTGVDLPEGKNCVGAFHQPALVWADASMLSTLPEREFRNGLAEVIKYGVIADPSLFALLEKNVGSLRRSAPLLAQVIARCARIKAGVVSRDERETKGLREILNFGHTLGHAVETVTGYRTYKHGEAVSIGMAAAGFLSQALGLWNESDKTRMEDLLMKAGLPVRLSKPLPEGKILEALARDKKIAAGELRYVLPLRIGKVAVRKVPYPLALQGLRYVQP